MKKFLILSIVCVLLSSCIVTSSAYNVLDDISDSFINTDSRLFLTEETKAGEIVYFGERITLQDKDGNWLSADDYVPSGAKLFYFNTDFWFSTVVLVGDADCNGKITAADARTALRISAGLDSCENSDKYGATDANFDGRLKAADAREVLRKVAGLSNYEIFIENSKKHILSFEITKPSNDKDYCVDFIVHPDYVNNPQWLDVSFYGGLVKDVEIYDGFVYTLILNEPTYENAYKLYKMMVAMNSVIMAGPDAV